MWVNFNQSVEGLNRKKDWLPLKQEKNSSSRQALDWLFWVSSLLAHPADSELASFHNYVGHFLKINLCVCVCVCVCVHIQLVLFLWRTLINTGMKYWSQRGWTLKTQKVKEARGKRLHTIWFHFYEMSKMDKPTETVAQSVKNLPAVQETWFNPWLRKIPWRRKWQDTSVLLPGKAHWQRSLAGYSMYSLKSWKRLSS